MDIIAPKAHRALLYLVTLATGGASPTVREFDEFAEAPDVSTDGSPYLGELNFPSGIDGSGAQRSTLEKVEARPGDRGTVSVGRFGRSESSDEGNYSDHFIRLGWARIIRGSGYISPTPLAYALLRGLKGVGETSDSVEVTPSPEHPMAYASLLKRFPTMNDVLVADPYLSVEQFQQLVTVDTVRRVLVKPQDKRDQTTLAAIVRGWSNAPEVREVSGMQDRYVVPRRGDGFMLGASPSAAGNKAMALVNLGGLSEDVRGRCERWWEQAKPLRPDAHGPEGEQHPEHGFPARQPEENVLELPPKK